MSVYLCSFISIVVMCFSVCVLISLFVLNHSIQDSRSLLHSSVSIHLIFLFIICSLFTPLPHLSLYLSSNIHSICTATSKVQ